LATKERDSRKKGPFVRRDQARDKERIEKDKQTQIKGNERKTMTVCLSIRYQRRTKETRDELKVFIVSLHDFESQGSFLTNESIASLIGETTTRITDDSLFFHFLLHEKEREKPKGYINSSFKMNNNLALHIPEAGLPPLASHLQMLIIIILRHLRESFSPDKFLLQQTVMTNY
jgi:hypothetical protein